MLQHNTVYSLPLFARQLLRFGSPANRNKAQIVQTVVHRNRVYVDDLEAWSNAASVFFPAHTNSKLTHKNVTYLRISWCLWGTLTRVTHAEVDQPTVLCLYQRRMQRSLLRCHQRQPPCVPENQRGNFIKYNKTKLLCNRKALAEMVTDLSTHQAFCLC